MKKNYAQDKTILFLTHYFPPEVNAPANRTFEHCREWTKNLKVIVLTNFPNHPDGKIFPGYKNKFIQKEILDRINVIRLWTFITPNEGFLLRSLNYLIYFFAVIFYVVFSRIKFDLIIATSPQFFCGLAGGIISKLKRKKFILEIRDLWPESILTVGAIKNSVFISILKCLARFLYGIADQIVVVTNSFQKALIEIGINEKKITVIHNGIDIDFFRNHNRISNKDLADFLSSGFIVGYIGTIGMAHGIYTIIEAAEKMNDNQIKFALIGSGADKKKIYHLINNKGLKNIRLFELQPRDEVPSIISKFDVFIVHLRNSELFKTVIPSKIFEGMFMRKPLLLGVDGETRDLIQDSNCGLFFRPEDSSSLIENLLLLKSDEQMRISMGNSGYNSVVKSFNRKKLAEEYFKLIQKNL